MTWMPDTEVGRQLERDWALLLEYIAMTEPKDKPAPDAPEDDQPEPADTPVEEPPAPEDDPSQPQEDPRP